MTIQMTINPLHWIAPSTMQALGWALLHSVWQGTALAALAAGMMAASRKAQTRYLAGVAILSLMLVAPVATFFFYLPQSTATPAESVVVPTSALRPLQAGYAAPVRASESSNFLGTATPWLVEAWLLGVVLFSLRSAGGFVLLERERRRQSSALEDRILQMCRILECQLRIRRTIRYCECAWLSAPAVIGWFRPVVFLPVSALTGLSEEQLELVIAHELAHIQRMDSFVNVFQIAVETILFYHPAVWWLNEKIRAEREHCCDETAIEICGNAVAYAQALTLMEEWRSAPKLAMAANRGPLTRRIVRILGVDALSSGMRAIGVGGSILCLAGALAAGNLLLDMARPKHALAAPQAQSNDSAQSTPAPKASPKPAPKPSAARMQSDDRSSAVSYVDGMKDAGYVDLTVDQLIAMKVQDVTPEYVRDIHAAGLNPTPDQLIALKVQGADAEYYRGLKSVGLKPDLDHVIAMKVQGVTPEYVRGLQATGLTLTSDEIIAMKVQDVTPEYLKQLRDLGLEPSANDLIAMKVQDVTPEWIRGIQSLGFKPSANELISMRVQDVTPEYIRALQEAGFKVGINDIISAKVQDVTPEFIKRAQAHGFKDLTLQKIIQLRQFGILDSKADL